MSGRRGCGKQNKWPRHHASSFPTIQLSQWKWSASDWAQFGTPALLLHHYHHYHHHHQLPSAHRHPPTPLTPAHARRPCSWTRSTSAQRNSFSNFPWLRKQYTCLNNVDISNALKRSSNGALIGSKWIQDYKHTEGAASLYCSLSDLHWTDILDWRKHKIKP